MFEDVVKYKRSLMGFFAGTYELALQSVEEFEEVYKIQKDLDIKLKKFCKIRHPKRKNAEHAIYFSLLGCSKNQIDPNQRRNKDNS